MSFQICTHKGWFSRYFSLSMGSLFRWVLVDSMIRQRVLRHMKVLNTPVFRRGPSVRLSVHPSPYHFEHIFLSRLWIDLKFGRDLYVVLLFQFLFFFFLNSSSNSSSFSSEFENSSRKPFINDFCLYAF
jgi:hypothetical protein